MPWILDMRASQRGVTMVELMVAITIGLLIVAGLAGLFATTSASQHELRRTSQQIENGRYAMDVLIQDLQMAGYFGQYRKTAPPASLPDPCVYTVAALTTALGLPVQGYSAATLTSTPTVPANCAATWLSAANLAPGSDVLVVRRADTEIVPEATATASGSRYIQSNATSMEVQDGGGTTSCTSNAQGVPAAITRRCQYPTSTDMCATECTSGTSPAGYLRKLRVHVYFVAPCSAPAGGGSVCTGANDDNGRPIPTLKRLELTLVGGAADFQVVPIAEGVEFMKLAYGIDDTPSAVNPETGLVGDGTPDRYVLDPNLAEYSNAVTARVDLLVRNPEPSPGYTDAKTYAMSVDPGDPTSPAVSIAPADLDTRYRRHAYNAEIRLINLSGRKEAP